MRSLMRNQQPVFFKLYEGEKEIVDEFDNPTGSFVPIYSRLMSAMLCVSPNKGNTEVQQFGSLENYDRTMTSADAGCLIDENSVLWVDGADVEGPYNYVVARRAPWKNSVQYAIRQVKVSEYQAEQKLFDEKARIEAAKRDAQNNASTE